MEKGVYFATEPPSRQHITLPSRDRPVARGDIARSCASIEFIGTIRDLGASGGVPHVMKNNGGGFCVWHRDIDFSHASELSRHRHIFSFLLAKKTKGEWLTGYRSPGLISWEEYYQWPVTFLLKHVYTQCVWRTCEERPAESFPPRALNMHSRSLCQRVVKFLLSPSIILLSVVRIEKAGFAVSYFTAAHISISLSVPLTYAPPPSS